MRLLIRLVAGGAIAILAACGHSPAPGEAAVPSPSVAPEPVPANDSAAVPGIAPLVLPSPSPGSGLPLVLTGAVTLDASIGGLANARDGVVAGAPVAVVDIATGRRIGHGITYYDGSYEAEVPSSVGKRAVLVEVMLVDARTHKELFPLVAPVELAPELAAQTRDVSVASTAWVDLLVQLAARQIDQTPPGDWFHLAPGNTARELAALVNGSQPEAERGFLVYADTQGTLGRATSADGLLQAIKNVVNVLVTKAKPG